MRGGAPAKLTDFGGARLAGEQSLTRTGDVLGTLAYMAPEQIEGVEVGAEADLYSLALVLYEALSGVNPVRGPTPAATARRIGERLAAAGAPPPGPAARADAGARPCTAPLPSCAARWPSCATYSRTPRATVRDAALGAPRERTAASLARPLQAGPEGPANLPDPRLPVRPPLVTRAGVTARAPEGQDVTGWLTPCGLPDRRDACRVRLADRRRPPWHRAARPPARPCRWCCWCADPALPGSPPCWPRLGLAALAGAFPAFAAQAQRWPRRAFLGALGFWWLVLAEPPPGKAAVVGTAQRRAPRVGHAAWERSPTLAAASRGSCGPLVSLATLGGVLVWAVRGGAWSLGSSAAEPAGRRVPRRGWAAASTLATERLHRALAHGAARGQARALLGALAAAAVALCARALRGPAGPL